MSMKVQCPACRSVHTWPEYARGKKPRCPKCQRSIVVGPKPDREGEEAPVVLDVLPVPDEADEVPNVETVEDVEEVPRGPAPPALTPAAEEIARREVGAGLTASQRALHVLLVRSF